MVQVLVNARGVGRLAAAVGLALVYPSAMLAQPAAAAAARAVTDAATTVGATTAMLDVVWFIVGGGVALFMRAGVAMAEAGFAHPKTAGRTATTNPAACPTAMLAYWAVGFARHAGGVGALGLVGGNSRPDVLFTVTFGGVTPVAATALQRRALDAATNTHQLLDHGAG